MRGLSPRLHIIDQTEAAGVVEADDGAVVERQHHMVVRRSGMSALADGDAPRHAEMQQQQSVRVELDQDVFAAPAERADAGAVEPLGEHRRKRPAQIGPAQLGPHDAAAGHPQREAAPDRFDFGQFGHRAPRSMCNSASYSGAMRS